MESFWAGLKRGYAGVYNKMTPKHLQRYVDEYVVRHNMRRLDTMEQVGGTFEGMEGKRLTYEELIREVEICPFPGLSRARRQSA